MSSSRPPPPPPKPPRLQAKRPYRPAAVLPIEAVTLPREAMESTEYLDVKHMIISKHVGIDQVDRATDHVDMVRTEPAQVAEQFFESPKPTDAQPIENQYYESVSSPELEIVDMQIEDDDHNEEEEDEKITDIVLNQDKSIETDDVVDEDNQQYEYFDEKQIPSNKSVNLLSDHVQRHSVQECNEEEEEYDEEALNKDIELAKSTKPLLFEIEEEKLLDHLRMRNPELLPKLIKMHLLMLLDLNGDTFASIFEESATVIEEGKRLGTIKRRKHESKNQDKCKLKGNVNIIKTLKLLFVFHSHFPTSIDRRRNLSNVPANRLHWQRI